MQSKGYAEETHFYNTFLNRGDPVFGEFNLDNFFVNNAVNIGVLKFLLVLEILKAMQRVESLSLESPSRFNRAG